VIEVDDAHGGLRQSVLHLVVVGRREVEFVPPDRARRVFTARHAANQDDLVRAHFLEPMQYPVRGVGHVFDEDVVRPVEVDHPVDPLGAVVQVAQPWQADAAYEDAIRIAVGQFVLLLRVGECGVRNGESGDDEIGRLLGTRS